MGADDGWIVLAPADRAPLVLPEPVDTELSESALAVRDALVASGASFFRQLADRVGSTDDNELLASLWDLVWAGWVTNDTLAPVRALGGGRRSTRARPPRSRGPRFPSRLGPPSGAGRWSLLAPRETDPTRRLVATTEQLLERHGIVTRGSLHIERLHGGFAAVYPVLKAMEEAGRVRRGYFVDGLGGAQFARSGAVDRMRSLVHVEPDEVGTVVLAATDPANPYGAALPWPEREGHRAGRKAGAAVVLTGGVLILYVEKGGRTILSFTDDPEQLQPAVDALALAAHDGVLGRLAVERADGESVLDSPFANVLMDAGFKLSSRGLRLRA